MTWLDACIMGLVQGLTEFLPISSSAHLRIVGEITGAPDAGAGFTAIIQIGTELAVLVYFRKEILEIITSWARSLPIVGPSKRLSSRNPHARLGWMIIVGTLPIAILGKLLEEWIDTTFRNLWITVVMLAVFGFLLGWADRHGVRERDLEHMRWSDAVLYGFAQALALIPGVSRSGGTITMGRFLGYTRPAAARYSFFLAMPAVFAAGFYKAGKAIIGGDTIQWGPTLFATLISFLVGYAVIVWFLKIVSNNSFEGFVAYRLILAGCIAILLLTHIIPSVSALVAS